MTPEWLDGMKARLAANYNPTVWEGDLLVAEVVRLRGEVDRHVGGMRQLLAQRDAAEAALEDVRQMARHRNWAGIVDLLVEKEGQ